MPILSNPRHEAFAQALARGKSQAEAYVDAGYKGDRTAASRLSTNINIEKRVSELLTKAVAKTELTAERVLEGLHTEATRMGEGTSQGARVAAWGLLGKYFSLFIERQEVTITHRFAEMSDDELRFEAAALLARAKAAPAQQSH